MLIESVSYALTILTERGIGAPGLEKVEFGR